MRGCCGTCAGCHHDEHRVSQYSQHSGEDLTMKQLKSHIVAEVASILRAELAQSEDRVLAAIEKARYG